MYLYGFIKANMGILFGKLSAIGFITALIVNIAVLLGLEPPGILLFALLLGLYATFLPAMLRWRKHTIRIMQTWAEAVLVVLLLYVLINLFVNDTRSTVLRDGKYFQIAKGGTIVQEVSLAEHKAATIGQLRLFASFSLLLYATSAAIFLFPRSRDDAEA
jgi:hypothetical protein